MAEGPRLLAGGNPQIPKGDGQAPVDAYIAAMPGWKQEIGRGVEALVTELVPEATRAVRWNSPFWGGEGQGFFLSIHCLTKVVRCTFFAGRSLDPVPAGGTPKAEPARWADVGEGEFDEGAFRVWIAQAARVPGWTP
ncbi:DUF1801 domain-containing protein [Wenxinia marina]|uniref:YdhG-like domain-containing protein n=1 Tax=Wenxinia marina DSM 24838 TaxID=1123501 RepID=A0A0D0Q9P6_9RHOB|nr:histidine kinase [Wenxinia marina]KIQ69087.1 hypothetical protein Wenmar_02155 [Wenxinia marina DSM 24838]